MYTPNGVAMYTILWDSSRVGNRNKNKNAMTTKHKAPMNTPGPAAEGSSHGALNIVEAAIYCGVRCSAIEEAVRDGRLLGRRLGRNIIILKTDLDAFLASLEVIAVHTPPSILKRRRERLQRKVAA